jgi:hypothetical protein
MDYFACKKELVISEDTGHIEAVKATMQKHNYHLTGSDAYRSINFSSGRPILLRMNQTTDCDDILAELESIIAQARSANHKGSHKNS